MSALAGVDRIDRRLLDILQLEFPLSPQPFGVLGEMLAESEEQVLQRVQRLKAGGIIRQISAIFDSGELGYTSTLVAASVPQDLLDEVAQRVSSHPGVSHNYARDDAYNLWFTLTIGPGSPPVGEEVRRLLRGTAAQDHLLLPVKRLFKIGVAFDLSGDPEVASARVPNLHSAFRPKPGPDGSERKEPGTVPNPELSSVEKAVVREAQRDLPLLERPFQEPAFRAGIDEEHFIKTLSELASRGVMRRFAAILRHRQSGFVANGMAVWEVPEAEVPHAGRVLASFPQVSHCYERLSHPPKWPYNLFSMIHARSKDDCETVVREAARLTGLTHYKVLYSVKEYKKTRVSYLL